MLNRVKQFFYALLLRILELAASVFAAIEFSRNWAEFSRKARARIRSNPRGTVGFNDLFGSGSVEGGGLGTVSER